MSVLAAEIGIDSPLYAAIKRARRRNGVTQFDYISLGVGTGSAGGLAVFTTDSTAAGQYEVTVGSEKFNTYTIAVAALATPTIVGDAVVAAITADAESMVTAVNTTGSVAITAKVPGLFGNTIGIKVAGTVPGMSVAVTAMTGGSADPTLTGVFDVVGLERYQGIAWQFDKDIAELTDFLDPRFNVSNNVLDGRGFVGTTDTYANHLTALGLLDSQSLCVNVDKLISTGTYKGPNILDIPFTKVAEFAGTRALRRTDEASLGDLVIARSPRDSFGGPWQNSKPYFNTPFPDLLVPGPGNSFTDVEIAALEAAGGWVIDANRPYNTVIAGQVVTTYKTDSAGNPDPTWKYLNYVDTATANREYIVNNTRARYPQSRATAGALLNDADSANEASIAAFVAKLNGEAGDLALVNTGVGTIDGVPVDYDKLFRQNLTVSLNPVSGRFFVSANDYIVIQLRDVTYDLAIAFEV
jgi:hypothetical protein